MTLTSYGFAGSLGATDWAKMAAYSGPYGAGTTDWGVSAVSGARSVSVAPGEVFAWNVRAVSDAAITLALPTPSAGQWFLIVARRDWSAKTTSVQYVAGDTTTTSTPTAPPAVFPAGLNQGPGVVDDQPLAWAWINNTSTTVTIWDTRIIRSGSGPNVPNLRALNAYAVLGTFLEGAVVTVREHALTTGTLRSSSWATRTGVFLPIETLSGHEPAPSELAALVTGGTCAKVSLYGARSKIVDEDTGITYRWNGTGWTAWEMPRTTYVPTVDNVTMGNGTIGGEYWIAAGICYFAVFFVLGSTTAVTGQMAFSFPIPAASSSVTYLGGGVIISAANGNNYNCGLRVNGSKCSLTVNSGGYASGTSPITLAVSDGIRLRGSFTPA